MSMMRSNSFPGSSALQRRNLVVRAASHGLYMGLNVSEGGGESWSDKECVCRKTEMESSETEEDEEETGER